ncbi:MAG: endonuclease MutS2 [Oscillospiraceae bacterium]|jgi:DNA mismatch repair protein MutS2
MTLTEKSLKNLEYPAVLEMLASEAVSDRAKEICRSLRPMAERMDIERALDECSAARKLIGLRGSPSFSGVHDVGGALRRAGQGGMLNTRELLDIAGVLKAAREAKKYGEGDGRTSTELDHLFRMLEPNRPLEDRITNSIISVDEIADAASAELASIRRRIRSANSRIRDVLQKMISSAHYQKALQEPIITMRSGRYVIPVRAEYRGEVSGLVHDVSGSGATVFIEPMQVVEANNEIRQLEAEEKAEIERILMELSAEADSFSDQIENNFLILVTLDCIFARGKLSYRLNAMRPEISGGGLILNRARHPLLPRDKAVPIDVRLGDGFDTLVITGPNTGGKTVALKTIGLLTLMAQSGLHIPADDGSRVRIFNKVLSDIGDEQSIEQSLSTFSAHMTNIISIIAEADGTSLTLFDELGAGTDPVEGAALAIAIIEELRERGAFVAATTHYAELKVFATLTEGVANASCEFDIETLRPTYRLLIGVPGKSNAFAISERLGLSKQIIERAKSKMSQGSTRFEEVIAELNSQRQEMEKARIEAAKAAREAEENRKKAEEYRSSAEKIRRKAEEKARAEAQRIIDETRAAADRVMEEMNELRKLENKNENWQEINKARAELRRELNEAENKLGYTPEPEPEEVSSRSIAAGDIVQLKKLGTKATVLSVGENGELRLQAGIMKLTVNQNEVRLLEREQPEIKKYMERAEQKLRSIAARPEIDLRGMTGEEAGNELENFIDGALMAKLSQVTIIHGKGTGAVRKAVHERLRGMKHVKSYRLGRYGEGETGVTIAELDV